MAQQCPDVKTEDSDDVDMSDIPPIGQNGTGTLDPIMEPNDEDIYGASPVGHNGGGTAPEHEPPHPSATGTLDPIPESHDEDIYGASPIGHNGGGTRSELEPSHPSATGAPGPVDEQPNHVANTDSENINGYFHRRQGQNGVERRPEQPVARNIESSLSGIDRQRMEQRLRRNPRLRNFRGITNLSAPSNPRNPMQRVSSQRERPRFQLPRPVAIGENNGPGEGEEGPEVPENYRWRYTIKYMHTNDPEAVPLDTTERDANIDRSFFDRNQANAYLDSLTSPNMVGGLESLDKRLVWLSGDERLLKVELKFHNGELRFFWVARDMVGVGDDSMPARSPDGMQPALRQSVRPRLRHWIVMCELFIPSDIDDTPDTPALPNALPMPTPSVNGDRTSSAGRVNGDRTSLAGRVNGDRTSSAGRVNGDGTSSASVSRGTQHDGRIQFLVEKLPPRTFATREMANEYAARTFREKTVLGDDVVGAISIEAGVWWRAEVDNIHGLGIQKAEQDEGLYEATMHSCDLSEIVGWDCLIVCIRKVDDVEGPVNI